MAKIKSNPTVYSHSDKFAHNFGTVKPNARFLLTGRGSKCESGQIRYYWRLVRGLAPGIVDVIEDGCTIKFIAPPQPTEIEFELKVKDLMSGEIAIENIIIKVTDEDYPKIYTTE